ncbi:MAG TPA: M48 family metalloprotease [Gammaproteobacteria bacterium]|nr:M48 family metalloprotease [Gammaproteobacteria bacterium]
MNVFPRCVVFWLAVSPVATWAEGNYGSVPIDEDEQHLIDSSNELEGYFASHSLIYGNEPVVTLVRRIGNELAPAATDDYIDYEFFVLRDPSPNAFALPNGHVYIQTGMLARLQDEAQLAALLAHEINHVAGHHGILGYRSAKAKTIAGMVLGGLGGWGSVISIGLQASVFGFSRDLEQEADDHAVPLLLASPYDPHALPEVFDILGQDYEGLYPRNQSIWSTHPEIRARAQTSRALVADLPRGQRYAEQFERLVFPLRVLTIQDYIQDDYPHTAVALAGTMVERFPDEPRLLQVLGDAWQAMGAQSLHDPEELSNADKRRNQRSRVRRTREQRLAELLETEEGRTAYVANLTRAEEIYLRALEMDADFALAHRGLGEVYEQLDRDREAAQAYLRYLRLAPDAADRAIIVDRLRVLAEQLKQQENGNGDA